ncbi:fumarylacetoacetase [Facilibium subflavum]|uniref:fumarylacetoacetase n=1 Tax=Facilibium subflavum TaxID=2219058 RepID=UPI000E659D1B|nr:fumarylacetoacetase [Facilibium subflavum]
MIKANNPQLQSFITVDRNSDFPIQNLPFGIFSRKGSAQRHIGVAIGDYILDLRACFDHNLISKRDYPGFDPYATTLNSLMAQGRYKVRQLRDQISELLRKDNPKLRDDHILQKKVIIAQAEVDMHLPMHIGGYTDFYSSKEHADNVGRMFRDKDNPLLPNWLHLPVAYDGRAGSVVVSGTAIKRPLGQTRPDPEAPPVFGATKALDVEVEMGTVIGLPSEYGHSIAIEQAPEHVFGMVLVNDWSARDIQKWEYVPLGPFLSKNFATSISPWVVTLDALEPFRVASPKQETEVLPYLARKEDWGVDIQLELTIQSPKMAKDQVISTTNFKHMYWDMMQQLAHHSVNGCPMASGDLLASGTISGATKDSFGSLLELTEGGKSPITLSDGSKRVFLEDGDLVTISGFCQNKNYRIGFGKVQGQIVCNDNQQTQKHLDIIDRACAQ